MQIQNASIDLRLSRDLRIPRKHQGVILSPKERILQEFHGELTSIQPGGYNLEPSHLVLGSTLERIAVPLHLVARLDGKSSLARIGLLIHFTSAHIAPGFEGPIVLEIINLGPNTVALIPEMSICQLIFEKLNQPSRAAYGGTYQGQTGP
ncbi:MAG: dCTP deaminase [Chloroflexi bacterium]|nr:dCTP deaminase [Chloroflexota bacterium]